MTEIMETIKLDLEPYIIKQYKSETGPILYFLDKPTSSSMKNLYIASGAIDNKKFDRWIISSDNADIEYVKDFISVFMTTSYHDRDTIKPGGMFDDVLKYFYISTDRLKNYTGSVEYLMSQISEDNFSWLFTSQENTSSLKKKINSIRTKRIHKINDAGLKEVFDMPVSESTNTASTAVVKTETYFDSISVNGYTLSDIGKAVVNMFYINIIDATDVNDIYNIFGKMMMRFDAQECLCLVAEVHEKCGNIHLKTTEKDFVSKLLNTISEEYVCNKFNLFVHHNSKCYVLVDNNIVEEPKFENYFSNLKKPPIPTRNPDLWKVNVKKLTPNGIQNHAQYVYDNPNEELLAKVELAAYDLYDPTHGLNIHDLAYKMGITGTKENMKMIRDCLHYLWYHCYQRKISHPNDPHNSKKEYWWKFK